MASTEEAPPSGEAVPPAIPLPNGIAAASEVRNVGKRNTKIDPALTFNKSDPKIQDDIIKMIAQYLESVGYTVASAVLQDEANVKLREKQVKQKHANRMRKYIIDGDWDTVATLTKKVLKPRTQAGFLYAVQRQEYLELIDAQQYEKAFVFLNTRLKPLETLSNASGRGEFADLCYLLTCKSVRDARSFAHWEGATASRASLASEFDMAYKHEKADSTARKFADSELLQENRLLTMLQQAVAYQMEFGRYHRQVVPKAHTLLSDYRCFVMPNAVHTTFVGHAANVKCVEFVGVDGRFLASGGSDNTIRIWRTDGSARRLDHEGVEGKDSDDEGGAEDAGARGAGGGRARGPHPPRADRAGRARDAGASARGEQQTSPRVVLRGHKSRVWDLSSHGSGRYLLSASGDSTVRVWDVAALRSNAQGHDAAPARADRMCTAVIPAHDGDVYTVQYHPQGEHAVTGSYDKMVKLFDLRTQQLTKSFKGHHASVSSAIFNPHGNLVISGSKDKTIRFWDILSGVCVKTFSEHLGEVTSVQISSSGILLLSSSKNSCNRLWDIRIGRPLAKRFKGHTHTSKNFVRAAFGPNERLIVGGSEDGAVYMWDAETCTFLQRLHGHKDVVYQATWNNSQSLLASCSHDGMVKTWCYRGNQFK
eukprot:g7995.t1